MKRVIALLLAVITIMSASLSLAGCSGQTVHIYTRGEWISELANIFGLSTPYSSEQYFDDVNTENEYFNAVQACAEWEIIEKGGKFEPDKRADVNFAMVTAVKAVGLDRIAKSVDGKELKTEEEIIEYFNDNSNVKYISGSSLYMDTAEHILCDIGVMYSNLQLKQYQDVQLKENVVSPNTSDVVFSADGETATIRNGNYNVGDVICFEPSTSYPEGKYAKITEINGNTIKYVEPTLDEIADHVTIYGTYEPEILGVVPLMDGVEVQAIDGVEVLPQVYQSEDGPSIIYLKNTDSSMQAAPLAKTFRLGDIDMKLNATVEADGASVTVSGGVKLKNIKATVDLDVLGVLVKKAEISVTDTIEANISVSGQLEKTFNIAKVPCKLWGVVGVDFVLAVKIGLEGSVSFVWSVDTAQSVEYKPFRAPKFHASGSNSNLDVELKAKAYIKPQFKAEFVIGPASVANVGAYSGVEASAKTKIAGTSDDVGCVDVSAYVPLTIFVGAETKKGDDTLLGKLGVKKSWAIWTSSTSPVKKKWHVENGEIVPECTKGKKEEEKTEEDNSTGNDQTGIDMDYINHILELDHAMIISSYYVVLDEGRTDLLRVIELPEGYTYSDLVFTTDNSAVATVGSDGTIVAVGSGSCTIKVATKDGKYEQFCSLRVLASYDVEFTPLSLWKESSYGIAVCTRAV